MATVEFNSINKSFTPEPTAWEVDSNSYRCHILILKEEEGDYSVVALNLPGAGSCGHTEEDAIKNAKEAIRGVIVSHLEAKEEIPWTNVNPADIPDGASHKVVIVNV